MLTLLGCVSSLNFWLTAKTWSVGTRGTSLKIETGAILCNRPKLEDLIFLQPGNEDAQFRRRPRGRLFGHLPILSERNDDVTISLRSSRFRFL